jgi:hypothetical protein
VKVQYSRERTSKRGWKKSKQTLQTYMQIDDIERNFTYHAPKADQPERYVYLREKAKALAMDFVSKCPDSRERSLALTKLEEAIFWANASIARHE